MILILHTTARYLAVATITTAGSVIAAVALTRHLCRVTPEAGEYLMAYIAEQLA